MNLLSTVILTLALAASIVHGQNFAPPQSIGQAYYAGTCTADLDNDGDLDIVTPRISGSPAQVQLAWYENLGPHTWGTTISATAQFIPTSPGIWDVHSADLDGDGDMDLVTVIPLAPSTTGGEVRWHENLGNGALWTTHVLNASAAYPRGSTTADIDGDGHLDILTADVGVVWYRNDGAGGFIQQPPLASGTGGQVSTARGADVDGDGDLDVLAARKGEAKITWFENLGAGAMGPGQDISSSAINTYGAIACDLDGDNDLDVVFIANNPDKVAWHENLGAGAFGPEQTLSLLSTDLRDLAVSDLDLDGDLDLVTGASGNDRVAWFENNGTGGFGPEQFIVNSRNTIDIHVADLDSDGAPDILTSRSPSLDVIWVKNTGQIT